MAPANQLRLSFGGSEDGEAETEPCRAAKLLWRKTNRTSGPQGPNLRNGRMRTRLYAGVAGENGRPFPLCRFLLPKTFELRLPCKQRVSMRAGFPCAGWQSDCFSKAAYGWLGYDLTGPATQGPATILTAPILGCRVRLTIPCRNFSVIRRAVMLRRAIWAFLLVVCLTVPVVVHAQRDYLDVYVVKVKPEKLADFEALTKKWIDANRRFNGDHWLAMETGYGDGNVFQFTSTRQDYADIDKVNEAEMNAANKAFGKENAEKMGRDFQNCLLWSHSELRRRRWDLSRKAPTDPAAYAKFIGESRVLRTTAVHVRPGRIADFEALLKEAKEAGEKNANTPPLFVSQAVEGSKGSTFYVTSLRSSLGGFDKNPTIRDILGEEGYKKFLQVNAESVEQTESALFRFSPELSNPPEEVAAVAADFWHPKSAMVASTLKPKSSSAKTTELKPTSEKPKQ